MRLKNLLLLGLVFLSLVAGGCAGSQAGAKARGTPMPTDQLAQYSVLKMTSSSTGEAREMPDAAQLRIQHSIWSALDSKAPGRFKRESEAGPNDKLLNTSITYTKYTEGSASARFFMAGFGQMHIDGVLKLEDPADPAKQAEYEMDKTFAWGGIYGATMKIEDVEKGFAEGVAAVLLGEHEEVKGKDRLNIEGSRKSE